MAYKVKLEINGNVNQMQWATKPTHDQIKEWLKEVKVFRHNNTAFMMLTTPGIKSSSMVSYGVTINITVEDDNAIH